MTARVAVLAVPGQFFSRGAVTPDLKRRPSVDPPMSQLLVSCATAFYVCNYGYSRAYQLQALRKSQITY